MLTTALGALDFCIETRRSITPEDYAIRRLCGMKTCGLLVNPTCFFEFWIGETAVIPRTTRNTRKGAGKCVIMWDPFPGTPSTPITAPCTNDMRLAPQMFFRSVP
jgi:hypothetical protein